MSRRVETTTYTSRSGGQPTSSNTTTTTTYSTRRGTEPGTSYTYTSYPTSTYTYSSDPTWSDMNWRMNDMGQGFRDMDRQFEDLQGRWRRFTPTNSPGGSFHTVEEGFPDSQAQNPIVVDNQGRRLVSFKFDLRQFSPEEITIKSFDDNRIEVSAQHDVRDNGGHRVHQEYKRTAVLPEGVDMQTVTSKLQPDGILCIEAPLPEAAQMRARNEPISMQIQHQGQGKK